MDQSSPTDSQVFEGEVAAKAVRQQLESITSSRHFSKSPRLCEFLRFVVEEKLEGRVDRIQENVIAFEVYNRRDSFDPRIDSIVRSEAHRLRARLEAYYKHEGRVAPVRISLSGRGYIPSFQTELRSPGRLFARVRQRWKVLTLGTVSMIALLSAVMLVLVPDREDVVNGANGIAVLPLKNLSANPEEEYFAEGITDSLITGLARFRGLRVISRQSMMQYRDTEKPAPEIAAELQVEHLIEGTVVYSENRVRISAQLIHGPTDRHLWAASYERELGEVLHLQRDVVTAIVGEIRFKLTTEEELGRGFPEKVKPDAYLAYLKGQFTWNKFTHEGAAQSIEYFQKAIAADPDFAAAYTGLSKAYRLRSTMGDAPRREMLSKSKTAVLRSLELDPKLAEGHLFLGSHYAFNFDWGKSEQACHKAIELAQGHAWTVGSEDRAECHHVYAILCLAPQGRLDDAETEIRKAVDLDPISLNNKVILGKILYFKRDFDQAVEELQEVLKMDENYSDGMRNLAAVYVQKQRYDEAIDLYERAQELSWFSWGQGLLAHGLALAGDTAKARALVDELLERREHKPVSPLAIATAYVGLGELDGAFEWLEKSVEEPETRLLFIGVDPIYDPLETDPRFDALLEKINLR